ncbi:hypothetical protein D3C86_2149360 [compost metagenome]
MLAGWIGAYHQEIAARIDPLVAGSRRQHEAIAGVDAEFHAIRPADQKPGPAGGDA